MLRDKKEIAAVRCLPGISLLLGGLAVCLFLFPAAGGFFQYDSTAIAAGDVWRIITGHLTHWSWDHLFWDTLAFVVLGGMCELSDRRTFAGCLAATAVLIPLSLAVMMPEVDAYRGLSGIDSALFALASVTLLRENVRVRSWGWVAAVGAVLCGFAAKIVFEYATGQTLFVDSRAADMVPIPLAHVVGGLVGASASIWSGLAGKQSSSTARQPASRSAVTIGNTN